MSQDLSKSSDHYISRLLSMAKTVAKSMSTHPLYIFYLIIFSPYILKLFQFFCPLLILLLATALCAFSTTTSKSNSLGAIFKETEDNTTSTRLEAEAYKIVFETFHDSVTSLADESDEVEAYKQIKIEALAPEIVKSCCSSTPLYDPPLHEIIAETAFCAEDELSSTKAVKQEDAKFAICNETEIIKHMVCSTINEHKSEDEEQVKAGVGMEINKAKSIPLTTTPKSGSSAAIEYSQTVTSTTDLHKTSKSYDLSSIGSMRREKEWTRTLACKLFEERHNGRGGRGEDGMDMLWETYDEGSIESPPPRDVEYDRLRTMSRRSSRSAKSTDRSIGVYADEDEEEEENDDDDVAASGKMCCLQALKMSSGKVNMGIKTKNMIKFSKALRGFGWLHKTNNTRK